MENKKDTKKSNKKNLNTQLEIENIEEIDNSKLEVEIVNPEDIQDSEEVVFPTISADFEIQENNKSNLKTRLSNVWNKLFKKKTKVEKEPETITPDTKEPMKPRKKKNTFLSVLIAVVITAILTFSATLIVQAIIENKKEDYKITVYHIGDKEVPSFQYYVNNESPLSIIDQRNKTTQEVRYNFEYTDTTKLNDDKTNYVNTLKDHDFILLKENPEEYIRYYEKAFVTVTFSQSISASGEKFILTIIFSRTI